MKNELVVAILWTLVGVCLVAFFAALVTVRLDNAKWSHVVTPTTAHPGRYFP